MSLLAELKSDAKALAAKFETIDEALLAKMEAIQANPGLMQLIDAGLAAVHVPAGAYGVVTGGLAELEKLYAQAFDPQQAAQPQFTPAGPQIAGQA
jgi:hypothetical protein